MSAMRIRSYMNIEHGGLKCGFTAFIHSCDGPSYKICIIKRVDVWHWKKPPIATSPILSIFFPTCTSPLINHPCTLCCQPTSMWCSRCQSAWYCSPEHTHSVSCSSLRSHFFSELELPLRIGPDTGVSVSLPKVPQA